MDIALASLARSTRSWRVVAVLATCLVAAQFAGCAQPGASVTQTSPPEIAGRYSGIARNTTGGQQGPMLLEFTQKGGALSGYVFFGYPLGGSGPVTGTVDGAGHVQLKVVSQDDTFITSIFTGDTAPHGALSGSYVVNNGQAGLWSVRQSG